MPNNRAKHWYGVANVDVFIMVQNEYNLFCTLIKLIVTIDPDILSGYETEKQSFAFIQARGMRLGIDFANFIGRVPSHNLERMPEFVLFNEFICDPFAWNNLLRPNTTDSLSLSNSIDLAKKKIRKGPIKRKPNKCKFNIRT